MDYLIAGVIGVVLLLLAMRGIAMAARLIDPLFRHNKRGLTHLDEGRYDKAILQFTEAADVDPEEPAAYYHNRASAYSALGQYEKAWADVHAAESLGLAIDSELLEGLRKASGRDR